MKFIPVLTLALAISLTSCNSEKKQNQANEAATEIVAKVLTPEQVSADGAKLVDQEIEIKGTVTHVCKHAGRKCSIVGENDDVFVQVMAGKKIGSFSADLIGSSIIVKGIVKERRITKETIAEQEAAVKEAAAKAEKANNAEGKKHCSHSMHNVNTMKQWMTDHAKDYYPIYFVEGISFKVAE